jgi:hypothetical protein
MLENSEPIKPPKSREHRPTVDIEQFKPKSYLRLWELVNSSPAGLAELNHLVTSGATALVDSRDVHEPHTRGEQKWAAALAQSDISSHESVPDYGTVVDDDAGHTIDQDSGMTHDQVIDMMVPDELFPGHNKMVSLTFPFSAHNGLLSISAHTNYDHAKGNMAPEATFEFTATVQRPIPNLPPLVTVFDYNASDSLPKHGTLAFFINLEKQLGEMGYPILLIDNTSSPKLIPYFLCHLDYIPAAWLKDGYQPLKDYAAQQTEERYNRSHSKVSAEMNQNFGSKLTDLGYMVQIFDQSAEDFIHPDYLATYKKLKQLFDELHEAKPKLRERQMLHALIAQLPQQ